MLGHEHMKVIPGWVYEQDSWGRAQNKQPGNVLVCECGAEIERYVEPFTREALLHNGAVKQHLLDVWLKREIGAMSLSCPTPQRSKGKV